ncbi:MAG: alcohol dehydrogenase catalytic domain-containing protein, partial [Planctomycetota bacterium]
MKAVTFLAPRAVACAAVPEPRLEREDDVVLRVDLAAICGSDLHVYRGIERGLDHGAEELVPEDRALVEAGSAVRGFRPGARAVSPFSTSCGRCFFCTRGLTSRCVESQLFGWVEKERGLHGGQAEYVRV